MNEAADALYVDENEPSKPILLSVEVLSFGTQDQINDEFDTRDSKFIFHDPFDIEDLQCEIIYCLVKARASCSTYMS